ncbi:cryptochrome DASH isoform X2 [Aplysia californica]|nr:cryptochrome DASH isoform X2 [Aplysia californica]
MSSFSSSPVNTVIYLFRNDLRVHDNEALLLANQKGTRLLPLYCFDPRHYSGTYHFGFPKTGNHRLSFLLDSVKDLQKNLKSRGSDLVIRKGKPEEVIPDLLRTLNVTRDAAVVFQKEVMEEEVKVEKAIEAHVNVPVNTTWGHTLYHVEDLPFQPIRLPDVYTQFRKKVEDNTTIRKCVHVPDALKPLPEGIEVGSLPSYEDLGVSEPEKDSRAAFPFLGGETTALERLHSYLWGTDNVSTYKETRNGMIGSDYSTKFSPWLAHGCLSPRKIYWEIKKYEKERTSNQSTYWVIFELIWRDYFRFVGLKYGNKLFHSGGIKGDRVEWKVNKEQFKAWQEGRTGVPYVDANMRELMATGFMSNRGRQNVASFLTKDLHLDWRLGAEWFESMLIDHDVCSNYGNWLYSAGIGNDPRENRKFNVVKQGLDYDAEGDYVRLWVPELAGIKTGSVHCVWTLSPAVLESGDVSLGQTYPLPLVKAPEWSRHVNRPGSSGGGRDKGPGSARGRGQNKGSHRGQGHQSQQAGQKRGLDFYFSSSKPH